MKFLTVVAMITCLLSACSNPTLNDESAKQTLVTKPQISIPDGVMSEEALWSMGRIGNVKIDVETGNIAYTVTYYSIPKNTSTTWIRICTEEDEGLKIVDEFVGNTPQWFGNSGVLAYLKNGKLYLRQDKKDLEVTGYGQTIEDFLLSPYRNHVILVSQIKSVQTTSDIYPDLPLASGKIVNDLMYKHWDEWTSSVPHPFIAELQLEGRGNFINNATLRNAKDILEGTLFECPMKPFGGVEQLTWSKDEKYVLYTCRKKTGLDYALSTESGIYRFDIQNNTHTLLTEGMHGYNINPQYSPNGQYVAWQSMEHDGYESDENRLFILDTQSGKKTFLTKNLNTNVDQFVWKDDSTLIFPAVWHGTIQLYAVDLQGKIKALTEGQFDHDLMTCIDDRLYFLRHSMQEADELYCTRLNGNTIKQLTFENKNIYDQIELGKVEPRWQRTTDGKQMLTWIIYPPHFDPTKKYPTLLFCEGGPQSPVSQFWSYRWNFMMMAAKGYIVVAPNRRGLPGFGKEWNEAISGDYGGQCMKDYLTAIDEFAANNDFVDKSHLGCVGASFGGFSVYWLAGHHDKRFKAFIAHDGIFNLEMQYLETEEKWFVNWDLGGAYWDKTNKVAQRSYENSPHRFVDKWDTPILCIHGERDYRILANQAMAAFDAAKMRDIPAQLLLFPDENHWVLKPQNGILWQRTFFAWLDKYLKN